MAEKVFFFFFFEIIVYEFKKTKTLIFNTKRRIIKKYTYHNIFFEENYTDKQEDITEYKYDLNDNIILKTSYTQKWFRHKNQYKYKYTYDENNNWTLKWIYDETLINDKVEKIIKRGIVYWKN